MKIHLLTAEHFSVPGLVTKAFATPQAATAEAVDLTNLMLKDSDWRPLATPVQWQHHVERLQDYHGAQYCYVEIAELDVSGETPDHASDTVDALTQAESFIAGFEDDELQEGVADLLAGLRSAIFREQAKPVLLEALKLAVERLEICNHEGEENDAERGKITASRIKGEGTAIPVKDIEKAMASPDPLSAVKALIDAGNAAEGCDLPGFSLSDAVREYLGLPVVGRPQPATAPVYVHAGEGI